MPHKAFLQDCHKEYRHSLSISTLSRKLRRGTDRPSDFAGSVLTALCRFEETVFIIDLEFIPFVGLKTK
jgi:hypothetical protein